MGRRPVAHNIGGRLHEKREAAKHVVMMISDFFYPRLGGVEMHIWSLAQCLLDIGHKVVVVTNQYGKRAGIRYMTNGLKVYYTPEQPFFQQDSFPSFVGFIPYLRQIILREGVTIVHGHQATSTMCHQNLMVAKVLGLPTVYTDHSLYGFGDLAAISANKLMKFTLSHVDHSICVSHTCRENLVLRANIDPRRTSAIPNAVDPRRFTPDPTARYPKNTINIVMVSRLVYRKGIDLAVCVIPEICRRFPYVHFIIGGDGPKKLLLEEMRERHQLHNRVELLGAIPHSKVRETLVRGHVFLNCSLTESFCIAILEAASAGLFVVSTEVGGVPEVLPPSMIRLASVNSASMVEAISESIATVHEVDPFKLHRQLRGIYSWQDVAQRTLIVYDKVGASPPMPLLEYIKRVYGVGRVQGLFAVAMLIVVYIATVLTEWFHPMEDIEVAPTFPREKFFVKLHKLGIQQEYGRMHSRRVFPGTAGDVSDEGGTCSADHSIATQEFSAHDEFEGPSYHPAPFDPLSGTPYAPINVDGAFIGRLPGQQTKKAGH
eukprot:gb/GECG01008200.1/.p1 GENE.gb/GECG01008200.1/~~gb/GECG01008200.1/.p1  ORF type:complete len:545 (+),score=38.67 gb/GECG01008200.1/:1-1635(+)